MGVDATGGLEHVVFAGQPQRTQPDQLLGSRATGVFLPLADKARQPDADSAGAAVKMADVHVPVGTVVVAIHQPRFGRQVHFDQQGAVGGMGKATDRRRWATPGEFNGLRAHH
ncbi:hypothetical protein D3C80_1291000 [compost metagenome]